MKPRPTPSRPLTPSALAELRSLLAGDRHFEEIRTVNAQRFLREGLAETTSHLAPHIQGRSSSRRARATFFRITGAGRARLALAAAAAQGGPGDCTRCGGDRATARDYQLAGIPLDLIPNGAGHITFPDGAIETSQGAAYCAQCVPGLRFCRVCGCTDEAACRPPCSWAKDPAGGNLCSRCARAFDIPGGGPRAK